MTEEPNKQEQPAPEKLLIDEPSNFQFHAAYLVYSDLFDQATSVEVKKELNGQIEALKQNQIDLETFYRNVAHHRKCLLLPATKGLRCRRRGKRTGALKSSDKTDSEDTRNSKPNIRIL